MAFCAKISHKIDVSNFIYERHNMKESVFFSNSPTGARKTNEAYKRDKSAKKTDNTAQRSSKEPGDDRAVKAKHTVYSEWLFLCIGLALSFLLLITSGDSIRSFSRSDGVVMISEYIMDKISKDESVAVFFGFSQDDKYNTEADAPSDDTEFSEEDIPTFIYGEGLGANDYIEKYNKINYTLSGVVPVMGIISSEYAFRKNPFYGVYANEKEYEFHSGIDIAADEGEPILCYLDGTVEKTALSAGYGYYVCVDHGGGLKTLYAHASKILCNEGDKVARGEVIAEVGSTGRSTGSHLHFEISSDGSTVNPKKYLGELYAQNR